MSTNKGFEGWGDWVPHELDPNEAQAEEERWIAFKSAHAAELERIKADPLRGVDAWGDRINQLRAEFRAAERVRKELERVPFRDALEDFKRNQQQAQTTGQPVWVKRSKP